MSPGAVPGARSGSPELPERMLAELAAGLRGEGRLLSADEAAQLAVEASPEVAVARAAVASSQAAADQAFVAVYPRVDLLARYTRLADTGPIVQPDLLELSGIPEDAPGFERILNNYSLQARFIYPVSQVFLEVLARQDAAEALARSDRHSAQARRQDTAMAARDAYYAYARTRAALVIARASLAESEAQARDVQARVDAGTLARVEQMRADALVAARRVAVVRTEAQLEVAKVGLLTLMGEPDRGEIGIAEDLQAPLPALGESRAALTKRALHTRSEVLAVRDRLAANQHRADAEAGGKWPVLEVGGSAE